jgi:glycine cleavage system protein P-like pyridoxal-binding family
MKSIAEEAEKNPELVKSAPHTTRIRRLDEVGAARRPILRWKAGETPSGDKVRAHQRKVITPTVPTC